MGWGGEGRRCVAFERCFHRRVAAKSPSPQSPMEAADCEDGAAPLIPRSNSRCPALGKCLCHSPSARSPMFVVAAATIAFVAGCIAWGIASPSLYPPTCLPPDFVDAAAEIPALLLDIRYFSNHNFMGRRAQGYNAPMCVLTSAAARALALVVQDAAALGCERCRTRRPQPPCRHRSSFPSSPRCTRCSARCSACVTRHAAP